MSYINLTKVGDVLSTLYEFSEAFSPDTWYNPTQSIIWLQLNTTNVFRTGKQT